MRLIRGQLETLGLVVVMAASAWLRFHDLDSISLSQDEAFSWLLCQRGYGEVIRITAQDVHPPLYYLLLKAWMALLGDSVFIMRSFSAGFGVATVGALFLFCRRIAAYPADTAAARNDDDRRGIAVALVAAALLALCNSQIAHGREVRMYPLGSFLAVLSSLSLIAGLQVRRSRWRWWSVYFLCAAGLLYTHNYGLFTVAAQALWAFLCLWRGNVPGGRDEHSGTSGKELVILFSAVAISYAPWIPALLTQGKAVAGNYWTAPLSAETVAGAIEHILRFNIERMSAVAGAAIPMLAGAVLLLHLIRARVTDVGVFLLATVPLACGIIGSVLMDRNILIGRCLFFSVPFFMVAVANVIFKIESVRLQRVAWVLVLGNLAALDAHDWASIHATERPGLSAAAEMTLNRFRDGDAILIPGSGDYLGFKYYARRRQVPVFLLRDDIVSEVIEGDAMIDAASRLHCRDLAKQEFTRAWIVRTNRSRPAYRLFPREWVIVDTWCVDDAAPYRRQVFVDLVRNDGLESVAVSKLEDDAYEDAQAR